MGSDRYRAILAVCLLLGSSAKESDNLPPLTNIVFGMDGMFCLLLQWNPFESSSNCSITYNKIIWSQNGRKPPPQKRGPHPNFAAHVEHVVLNEEILFILQAACNNGDVISKNMTLPIKLATGDPKTSVRDFSCTWYYLEYVQCTWKPGEAPPPNVNYTLLYWVSEENGCERANFSHSKQFHDLLPTGSSCANYTHNNGIPSGCRFTFQKSVTTLSKLLIAASDWSKEVNPYFYYVPVNNIAKLKPPIITKFDRTSNGTINVTWNDTANDEKLVYEVRVGKSDRETQEDYKVPTGVNIEIPNALPDVTYTVTVRVSLSQYARESKSDDEFFWSDWSEECILPGAPNERNLTTILLFLLIPSVIIVSAVILLIYMKRLKILIFPRIPDPGKMFSNDLQQWLKNGRSVYSEPRKEEICPISMLETPLTSPPVE